MTSAIVHFPWADVERADDLAGRYGWNGHISWWDFSVIPQQIDALETQGRYWITTHGDPSGLQHLCMWVGDEKFLMTLATGEDLQVSNHHTFPASGLYFGGMYLRRHGYEIGDAGSRLFFFSLQRCSAAQGEGLCR